MILLSSSSLSLLESDFKKTPPCFDVCDFLEETTRICASSYLENIPRKCVGPLILFLRSNFPILAKITPDYHFEIT